MLAARWANRVEMKTVDNGLRHFARTTENESAWARLVARR